MTAAFHQSKRCFSRWQLQFSNFGCFDLRDLHLDLYTKKKAETCNNQPICFLQIQARSSKSIIKCDFWKWSQDHSNLHKISRKVDKFLTFLNCLVISSRPLQDRIFDGIIPIEIFGYYLHWNDHKSLEQLIEIFTSFIHFTQRFSIQ